METAMERHDRINNESAVIMALELCKIEIQQRNIEEAESWMKKILPLITDPSQKAMMRRRICKCWDIIESRSIKPRGLLP